MSDTDNKISDILGALIVRILLTLGKSFLPIMAAYAGLDLAKTQQTFDSVCCIVGAVASHAITSYAERKYHEFKAKKK